MNMGLPAKCEQISSGLNIGLTTHKFLHQICSSVAPSSESCRATEAAIVRNAVAILDNLYTAICTSNVNDEKDQCSSLKTKFMRSLTIRNFIYWSAFIFLPDLVQRKTDDKREKKEISQRQNSVVESQDIQKTEKHYPHFHMIAATIMGIALAIFLQKGVLLLPLVAFGSALISHLVAHCAPTYLDQFDRYGDIIKNINELIAHPKLWILSNALIPPLLALNDFSKKLEELNKRAENLRSRAVDVEDFEMNWQVYADVKCNPIDLVLAVMTNPINCLEEKLFCPVKLLLEKYAEGLQEQESRLPVVTPTMP